MIKYPLNVTIDSNVFDANKYDLADNSTLSLLISYVEKQKIKVTLSNIVVNEILKHIQDKAYEIATIVNNLRKNTIKSYPESLIKNLGMEHILTKADRIEMAQKAKDDLYTFIQKLNAEILDNSTINVENIFNDYFAFNPPFENNDKKRKEFPDAFIAAQIRARFCNGEKLAIISADKGFIQACGSSPDYMFFDSLGKLYDALNKEEEYYNKAVTHINNFSPFICDRIKKTILENDCVNVIGISIDKDGIQYGYDYSETMVEKVSNVLIRIHTIDEISEEHVSATLVCSADVDVNCYYEDYDNAAWDSESHSFLYLEVKEIKEIHKARFGVRVEINIKSTEFKLSQFTLWLGGDSRKDRFEVTNDKYFNYNQDIINMDRKNAGLLAMDEYEGFLEEKLSNSKMQKDLVNKFENINNLLSEFENISIVYYEIMERIKESPDEAKKMVLKLSENMKYIDDFPLDSDISDLIDEDVTEFYAWIEDKYMEIEKLSVTKRLPSSIEFGNQISFSDAYENIYTLTLDEIKICPLEGQTERIDIWLLNNSNQEIHKGYIELTVGYITLDEDGGIDEGLDDNIEFYYDEIIKGLDDIIDSFKDLLDSHNKLNKYLENTL